METLFSTGFNNIIGTIAFDIAHTNFILKYLKLVFENNQSKIYTIF